MADKNKTPAKVVFKKPENYTPMHIASLKAIPGEMLIYAFGEGLFLRISPKGKKSWFTRCNTLSAEGKRKQNNVPLGEFSALGIKEARQKTNEQKGLAKSENTNLAKAKREERIEKAQIQSIPTFQKLAEDWLELKTAEWEGRSTKQSRGRLAANVYPVIVTSSNFLFDKISPLY